MAKWECMICGYVYDEELTDKFTKAMGDWSPVDPIKADWLVFKLEDKEKYPDYKEIKVLVQPAGVPLSEWAEYAEGELDSKGEIQFYSQQALIEETLELIE